MPQQTGGRGRTGRASPSARSRPRRAAFVALAARASCGARPRRRATHSLPRLGFLLLFLLLAVALLAEVPAAPADPPADSPFWARNAPLAHLDPQRSGHLDHALATDTLALLWQSRGEEPILAGPVMDEERVYTVDRKGTVTARWIATGTTAWERALGEDVAATPGLGYGWLYVATLGKKLHALERHTGNLMASADLSGAARAPTLVAEARVFQGTDAGKLHVLDAMTLTEYWSFDTATTSYNGTTANQDTTLRAPIRAPPALSDGRVFAASHNGRVYAFSVAGNVHAQPHTWHWTATVGDLIHAAPSIDRHRDRVLVGTHDGRVLALRTTTGATVWTTTTGSAHTGSVAVDDTIIVAASSDAGLTALHATNGTTKWQRSDGNGLLPAPLLAKDAIVMLSGNGTLVLVARSDGTTLPHPDTPDGTARWHLPGATHATPAATRNGIALSDHTGTTSLLGPPPAWVADLRAQEIRLVGAPDPNGTVELDLRVRNQGPDDAPDVLARLERDDGLVEERRLGALAVGEEQRWVVPIALGTGSHRLEASYQAVGATDPHPQLATTERELSLATPPPPAAAPDEETPPSDENESAEGVVAGFASGLAGAWVPGLLAGAVLGAGLARWSKRRGAGAP